MLRQQIVYIALLAVASMLILAGSQVIMLGLDTPLSNILVGVVMVGLGYILLKEVKGKLSSATAFRTLAGVLIVLDGYFFLSGWQNANYRWSIIIALPIMAATIFWFSTWPSAQQKPFS